MENDFEEKKKKKPHVHHSVQAISVINIDTACFDI